MPESFERQMSRSARSSRCRTAVNYKRQHRGITWGKVPTDLDHEQLQESTALPYQHHKRAPDNSKGHSKGASDAEGDKTHEVHPLQRLEVAKTQPSTPRRRESDDESIEPFRDWDRPSP
jgi:hypothetical protein